MKLNRRGFTLVELMTVLIILALIAVIAVPNITRSINKSRENLLNTQIANFKDAAKLWGAEHLSEIPGDETDPSVVLDLMTLYDEGYIDEKVIKDPVKKKNIDMDRSTVTISYKNNKYVYTVKLEHID